MARNPEYKQFQNHLRGAQDNLPNNREYPATDKEVGWWKQWQVRRSLNKVKKGVGTEIDYSLVQQKTGYVRPWGSKVRRYIKER